ncbi:MAG TPA: tetratricopeptide repeat protein [Phycisphaerae bacterium]|nr:tetratricopeptide repeat protein [Phycisphaerae bacterium]
MTRKIIPLLLLAAPFLMAQRDEPHAIPDKAATRKKIDDLIAKFKIEKTKATLGMLEECIELSISYGAPAWNEKDHEECCNFYTQTVQSLTAAFPDDASATPGAQAALKDLRTALKRVQDSKDIEANAWSLRYAFDKTQIACEIESTRAEALVSLGSDYLARADVDDAMEAYTSAEMTLGEMRGRDPKKLADGIRIVPIAVANGLLAQKKYHDAAVQIARGAELVPELPGSAMDLHNIYRDPAVVDRMMSDLKAELRRTPDDAALQFLMGYEYYFTGDRAAAKPYFEKALALDPKNALPNLFLHPPAVPPKKTSETPFRL